MAKEAAEVEDLPRVMVRRMVKDKLPQFAGGEEILVQKDALLAFSESARIFIHYLSATGHADRDPSTDPAIDETTIRRTDDHSPENRSNDRRADDICKESKRQTINADDVLKALEEIDFPEFVGPLQKSLDDFRQKNAPKKSVAKEKQADKKRERDEDKSAPEKEKEGEDEGEGEGEDEDEENKD